MIVKELIISPQFTLENNLTSSDSLFLQVAQSFGKVLHVVAGSRYPSQPTNQKHNSPVLIKNHPKVNFVNVIFFALLNVFSIYNECSLKHLLVLIYNGKCNQSVIKKGFVQSAFFIIFFARQH